MIDIGHIVLQEVSFSYFRNGDEKTIFNDLLLDIESRRIVALLGPSGSGKSTLLGLIAGFLRPTSGSIFVDGDKINSPGPDRGVVFQNHCLFPWKTVAANIEFGLRMQGMQATARMERVAEVIKDVDLSGYEDAYPVHLSGGMSQRVGFARMIVNRPRVMLMDEPFGSLDALTRSRMYKFFLDLWERYKTTVLLVTHDLDEALLLADRLITIHGEPVRVIDDIAIENPRPSQDEYTESSYFKELRRTLRDRLLSLDSQSHNQLSKN